MNVVKEVVKNLKMDQSRGAYHQPDLHTTQDTRKDTGVPFVYAGRPQELPRVLLAKKASQPLHVDELMKRFKSITTEDENSGLMLT